MPKKNKNEITEKDQEEKILDIKGTLESFVEEEPPEMSQEDAIKEYKEYHKKNKKTSNNEETESEEDEEHLKRVKKELLASLERVDEMSHKIFDEKNKEQNMKNIKIKSKPQRAKDREKVMEQMREKVEEEKAKEGREKE